jgi:NADPH:quinone reductase-like Zn-dependent oxidoreductase
MARRVCALVSGGGYAEYCVAPTGQCLNIPGPLSMLEGAALPEAVFTVWTNLFGLGGAKRGDTVLVHGGTSGIGTTAILLGRLFEMKVIVTAGSDEKCARAVELGAAYAINYRSGDYVEAVKELTGDRGVQSSRSPAPPKRTSAWKTASMSVRSCWRCSIRPSRHDDLFAHQR